MSGFAHQALRAKAYACNAIGQDTHIDRSNFKRCHAIKLDFKKPSSCSRAAANNCEALQGNSSSHAPAVYFMVKNGGFLRKPQLCDVVT